MSSDGDCRVHLARRRCAGPHRSGAAWQWRGPVCGRPCGAPRSCGCAPIWPGFAPAR